MTETEKFEMRLIIRDEVAKAIPQIVDAINNYKKIQQEEEEKKCRLPWSDDDECEACS